MEIISLSQGKEILCEINLSLIASLGYKRYESIIESKGFKISSSSLGINYSDSYDLKYKKGNNSLINIGIIYFASPEAESTLRSSFSDYDFVLTKIEKNVPKENEKPKNNPTIENPPIKNPAPEKPNPKNPSPEKPNPEPEKANQIPKTIPLEENNVPEINKTILDNARGFIDSKAWSQWRNKTTFDGKAKFIFGETKCNEFVYDILQKSGIDLGLPNKPGRKAKYLVEQQQRPFTCKQWYNEEVPNFICIGKGVEALEKSLPGDIITDGKHMGIISGPNLTINANSKFWVNKVVENDWGWREDQKNDVKIFRYSNDVSQESESHKKRKTE